LYDSYLGFARATGGQHAAVWFWKSAPKIRDGKLTGSDLASKIDADACAAYSKKLQLDVAKSPYVVMTTSYPSLDSSFKNDVSIEMGELRPESQVRLLTVLGDQISKAKLNQAELNSAVWWAKWRDAANNTLDVLSTIARHVKIKLKTEEGDLTIEGKE
jgi:hypothetical protein